MSNTLTIDEFRARIEAAKVPCSLCNFRAHSIVAHLQTKHGLSVGQYKKSYPNTPIVSSIVTELLRQLDRKAYHTDQLEAFTSVFQSTPDTEILFDELKKKQTRSVPAEAMYLVPAIKPHFFFEPAHAKAITFSMTRGKTLYAEGPTGCGKTEAIEQAHARMGLPMLRVNMNGDATVANFIGSMQADPQKGTYYKLGDLPTAMKLGVTLLVDEIDYTPPAIAAVLNPVLEAGRSLHIPETGETIVAADGFNVMATGNTGGKGDNNGVYTGTEILNTALLDRFTVKLNMDYLPMPAEISMLAARYPGKDRGHIQKLVQLAGEIRTAFKRGTLPVTLSTRKLVEILFTESELGEEEALNYSLLNWLDDDTRQVVLKIMENNGFKVKLS